MEMYLSETFKIVLVEEIIKKKKKTRLSLQENPNYWIIYKLVNKVLGLAHTTSSNSTLICNIKWDFCNN